MRFTQNKIPSWFKEAKSLPLVEYGASIVNVINPYHDEISLQKHLDDINTVKSLKNKASAFPIENKKSNDKPQSYDLEADQEKLNDLFNQQ